MKTIILGKVKTLSPIHTGSDEVSGIDRGIRRREYLVAGETIEVPIISANSFRGILRRVIANDFVHLLGLELKTLVPSFYYLLFSGGALSKSEGVINITEREEFYKNIPMLRVFGGATGSAILPGLLIVEDLVPIVKELEEFTGYRSDISLYDVVSEEFGTRKDDYPYKGEVETQTQQMLYRYEVLKAGIELILNIYLQNIANELDEDLIIRGLRLLKEEKRIGAKSNIGLGRLKYPELPEEKGIYKKYIEENKEKIIKYLKENEFVK